MKTHAILSGSKALTTVYIDSIRQVACPSSARPQNVTLSCDNHLVKDLSLRASFSGRVRPSPAAVVQPSVGRKRNLSFQVAAFYSEQARRSTSSTSTCEEDEKRSARPNINVLGTKRNFYEVLGVTQDATEKEIRAAYRQKALKFHPDLASPHEKDQCTKLFAQMNEAYRTLLDPHSRSLHDAKLSYFGRRTVPTHVPGFNSYSYNLSGFKTDMWARNAARKSESVPSREMSTSSNAVESSLWTTDSVVSRRFGNWETDQCW